MENVVEERKQFVEVLTNNIDFYSKFWTKTLPNEKFREYSTHEKKTKKVYCFGCEQTIASDLPDEQTWPYLLAKELGSEWRGFNFGKQNSSLQEICRIFYQIITSTPPQEYPDAVYFLFPDILRTEYIGNIGNTPVKYSLLFDTFDTDLATLAKYRTYTSMLDTFFYSLRFFNIIKIMCENRGIKWYWFSCSKDYQKLSNTALKKYLDTNTILDNGTLSVLPSNRVEAMQFTAKRFAALHNERL